MKIFIGPTGVGLDLSGLEVLPPAEQGNIAAAALEGPDTLILVDGYFAQHLAPWHKEILMAISKGCRVIGAGSLGALRAVECARYGMEGVGKIAQWYRNGTCTDDADVALAHRHAEDGFAPVSVPMVNLMATADFLNSEGHKLPPSLIERCRGIFYAERNWSALKHHLGTEMANLLKDHYIDQKSRDAQEAIRVALSPRPSIPTQPIGSTHVIESLPILAARSGAPRSWQMATRREEAIDARMIFELASAVGIRASDKEVEEASEALWRNLGITDSKAAKAWMSANHVTEDQWGRFCVREAVIKAARNWFDAASCGCDLIPATLEHQLLKPIKLDPSPA